MDDSPTPARFAHLDPIAFDAELLGSDVTLLNLSVTEDEMHQCDLHFDGLKLVVEIRNFRDFAITVSEAASGRELFHLRELPAEPGHYKYENGNLTLKIHVLNSRP